MSEIKKIIEDRKIPELMKFKSGAKVKNQADFMRRREEIKIMLQEEEYGYIPPRPDHLEFTVENAYNNFAAGDAVRATVKLRATFGEKEYIFPITSVIPKEKGKHPAFIHINFRPNVPDDYQPTEEIVQNGFAVFTIYYKDITSDNNDFKNGIAPILKNGRRKNNSPGKIAMWAWAAMRVMDYVESLDCIDLENVAVIGHSRLGKTALLAGAFDERFKYVISNDSGCSGAAITRGKVGESTLDITKVFPFWFCPKYLKTATSFEKTKYDQHFLIALSAPRHVLIGSADLDTWADPASEFLGAVLANEAYEIFGKRGLVHDGKIPQPKTVLGEGDMLYQLRDGSHYLSRRDWHEYMNFIKNKMAEAAK